MIPLADYNALEGTDISLAPDEVLTYFPDEEFDSGEIVLGKENYHVKENLKESNLQKKKEADVTKNIYLVMADDAAVEHVIQLYGPTKIPITMQYLLNFDMKGNDSADGDKRRGAVMLCRIQRSLCTGILWRLRRIFLPWNFCRILVPDGDGPDHLLQTDF